MGPIHHKRPSSGEDDGEVVAVLIDQELKLLAAIAGTIESEYIKEGEIDPWAESPFGWIKLLRSRQIGRVGEQLVAGWCAAKGLDVVRSPDSEADRIIGGRRVEIKFSILWASGVYKFQQIRDQDYEVAICLGISPFDASCWVVPKAELLERLPHQHGGAAGRDTRWLSVVAAHPPEWLAQYGGSLSEALTVLKRLEIS